MTNELALLFLIVNDSGDIWEVNQPLSKEDSLLESEKIQDYLLRGPLLSQAISLIENEIVNGLASDEYMTRMYDIGKRVYGKERLRLFFSDIYSKLTERNNSGARMGDLIEILTPEVFISKLKAEILVTP